MRQMLEKLLGRYVTTKRYESAANLAKILKSLMSGYYRVNIYDASGAVAIAYTNPEKGTVLLIGLDQEESIVEPPDLRSLTEGYAEVFALDKETYAMDLDIVSYEALVHGKDLRDIAKEANPEELLKGPSSAGEAPSEDAGSLADTDEFRSLYDEGRKLVDIDNLLSQVLTRPSGRAKILIAAEELILKSLNLQEALAILRSYILSKRFRNVAIKLQAGDNEACVVKLGNRVGVALMKDGKPVLWGTGVVKKLEKVSRYVRKVMGEVGKADAYIYILPDTFQLHEETREGSGQRLKA